MVFILDDGSVFEAPLDKIWRYMQSASDEEHVHRSMQNVMMEMDGDHPVMLFETETPMGRVKNKLRLTFFAPVGFLTEYMDGPMKGSKVMQYYSPMGASTGVTVIGEYVSPMMPEAQLKEAVKAQLEQAFNEDQANLQKFT